MAAKQVLTFDDALTEIERLNKLLKSLEQWNDQCRAELKIAEAKLVAIEARSQAAMLRVGQFYDRIGGPVNDSR